MVGSFPALADPLAFERAAEALRILDRDRYLTTLFAPATSRPYLTALYAFNAEVARVRDTVSDPMLGEIRLQWWRDAVTDDIGGGNPVATALLETVRQFSLPRDALVRMLEARVFDLYDDAMPSLNDLEGYAGDTASSLYQMAAIVLAGGMTPDTAEAAGHAGVAETIVANLRQLPRHLNRLSSLVPRTMLEARGLEVSDLLQDERRGAFSEVLAEMRGLARQHITIAQQAIQKTELGLKVAFLPLSIIAAYLDRMEKQSGSPLKTIEIAAWRRQWILWKASRDTT